MLRAVINNVLVNFIGDGEGIPAHAEIANKFQFFAREYFSRGIVRRIDDDGLGLGAEGARQFVAIEIPVRRLQLHEARRGAGKNRVGAVILVERLEDDDFVAGIDDAHHGGHHGFGRAAADGDFALGIDAHALRALEFPRNGVAQFLRAPGDGVLVDVVGDGLARGFLDFFGRGKIRKSLRHVDGVMLHGQARHFANHGFGESLGLGGQFFLHGGRELARAGGVSLARAQRVSPGVAGSGSLTADGRSATVFTEAFREA